MSILRLFVFEELVSMSFRVGTSRARIFVGSFQISFFHASDAESAVA